MERQFVRKEKIGRKRRSELGEAQGDPANSKDLGHSHVSQPEQSLLRSTARRIGSVLGKIVAKTESLGRGKPRLEINAQTTTAPKRYPPEEVSKPVRETRMKRTRSVSGSPSKVSGSRPRNVKRLSRSNRAAPRKARSDRE